MSDHHHLYGRSAWRKLRLAQLAAEPLCRMCRELGRFVEARVVDHVQPHRGDETLFFDATNLQSLCKRCHDSHKQAQEHQADGLVRGAGLTGAPLDLAHPWHAAPRPRLFDAARDFGAAALVCAVMGVGLGQFGVAAGLAAAPAAPLSSTGGRTLRRVVDAAPMLPEAARAAHAAAAAPARGLAEGVGGGRKSAAGGSNTGWLPPFATSRNWAGGGLHVR